MHAKVARSYNFEIYKLEPGEKPYNWDMEGCDYGNVERGFSSVEFKAALTDNVFNWLDDVVHEPRHCNTFGDPIHKYLLWQKEKTSYDFVFNEINYITELIFVFHARAQDKLSDNASPNLDFKGVTFYHRLPQDFCPWKFTLPLREDPNY